MNANDFDYIQVRLKVVLPTVFKRFMATFPNDRTCQLRNDSDVLSCNGELFAIGQLQRFFNPNGFDYYELQPELKSRRFIEIGGDGCGNYFCMVGDDAETDEVWVWEHDPYDGLRRCGNMSLTDYFQNGNWELATLADPFRAATGTYILRCNHPVRAIFEPIALDEWLRYVEQMDFLELDENVVYKHPFKDEEVVVRRWPGRAKLRVGHNSTHVYYVHGALSLGENALADVESPAKQIAVDLNASVWTGK